MCRVHQYVQQAQEMVFCDSTPSLDRFNTSLFVISTANAIGGLPLGVIITSDEEQETISQGLGLLKEVVPIDCFYGNGSSNGPSIIMTDDSCAERNVLVKLGQIQIFFCAPSISFKDIGLGFVRVQIK